MPPRIIEVVLPFPPMSLNPYLRTHWAERYAIFKPYREVIADHFIHIDPFYKVHLEWEWTFFGSKPKYLNKDGDNISSIGVKIIQDILVEVKVLQQDSNRYIQNPVLIWTFNDDTKDPEIYGSGEVLLRLSTIPLYGGQLITLEDEND